MRFVRVVIAYAYSLVLASAVLVLAAFVVCAWVHADAKRKLAEAGVA